MIELVILISASFLAMLITVCGKDVIIWMYNIFQNKKK